MSFIHFYRRNPAVGRMLPATECALGPIRLPDTIEPAIASEA